VSDDQGELVSVRVWDLPTRLFHWILTILIAMQYATGQFGVLDMRWHYWLGYATLALLVFRISWGFIGSQTSRFSEFLRGPATVFRHVSSYLYKNPQSDIGHNPLGGWSVLIMLACVLAQAISGLFTSDEISENGPFVGQVAETTTRLMTRVHHWNQSLLLLLIAFHVAAVLLHLLLKHDNLITPMFNGRKRFRSAENPYFASSWLALALLVLSAGVVAIAIWLAGG
jgi:cytochrome b